ncbi:YceI family protein [Paracoccus luteus]|uniref:YceI family protein n=1 Tax=Paracoccus luteus TaxID=2508543 RepID=UPI001FE82DAB|nr:YceI family protein [Paracoccus luteus]
MRPAALALAAGLCAAWTVAHPPPARADGHDRAAPATAAPAPDSIPRGRKDAQAATAGRYVLDPGHTAVIVRVPHMGFSNSVFRFDKVQGALDWQPARIEGSALTATVQAASISTPVAGFAAALAGPDYLDAAAHPTATFTSTAFAPASATAGTVRGDLTIMGRTHPADFAVQLVGAGPGYTGDAQGNPVIGELIGVTATAAIDPQAYGLNPFFTDPIEIRIDAEFAKLP